MKIAVLDINTIFEKSKRGKALTVKLQGAGRVWQQKLQTLEDKRKRLQTQFSASTTEPAPEAVLEYRGLEMELSYMRQRSEAELKALTQQLQGQLMQEFMPVMQEFAKQNQLQMVLTAPAAQLLYVDPAVDVTDAALAFYDGKVKV